MDIKFKFKYKLYTSMPLDELAEQICWLISNFGPPMRLCNELIYNDLEYVRWEFVPDYDHMGNYFCFKTIEDYTYFRLVFASL